MRSIAQSVGRMGYWMAEARAVQEAAGLRRIGPRNWNVVRSRLAASGYELELEEVAHESDMIRIRPLGTAVWLRRGELLIEHLDRASGEIPEIANWRTELVNDLALHRWAAGLIRHESAITSTEGNSADE